VLLRLVLQDARSALTPDVRLLLTQSDVPTRMPILSKARNRLSDDQAIILYGMSENLHHLHKARVDMMDKIQDSAG
jgi:hypothetical protein